jgi:Cu2+-exporting ATPase
MTPVYSFSVPDITCGTCTGAIDRELRSYPEIKTVHTNLIDKTVHITLQENVAFSEKFWKKALEDIGFSSSIEDNYEAHRNKGLLAGIPGISLFILAIAGLTPPTIIVYGIAAICSGIQFYVGKKTITDAYKKFTSTKLLTMDALFAVSTSVAWVTSILSLCFPTLGLPLFFDAALMIFGFHHIGKAIEKSTIATIKSDASFRDIAPKEAQRYLPDNKKTLSLCLVQELKPNDVIVIQSGQIIPVDGKALNDTATIYKAANDGVFTPQTTEKGEPLFAGMKVAAGTLQLTVTASEAESRLARSDNAIALACNSKMPIETFADNVQHYFIPSIFSLSLLSGIGVGIFFTPLLAVQTAISVLVSACPCILGIIVPLSTRIGVAKAAKHNILLKNSESLEIASKIDIVVFDLNGTLTEGNPVVTKEWMNPHETISPHAILYALEKESNHPIAKAICSFIPKQDLPHAVTLLDTKNASVIRAAINNETYTIGNEVMMRAYNIDTTPHQALFASQQTDEIICIARGETIIGYLILRDNLRKNAKTTIDNLHKMGKDVRICSGSTKKKVLAYAAELGITDESKIEFNCTGDAENIPKIKYIETLQANHTKKVAMIGDYANDAAAFSQSDLGIVVQSAATDDISKSKANVIICDSSLEPIVNLFTIANQTLYNIKQNLLFSLAYNIGAISASSGLLLTFNFCLNPGIAALLMICQSSLVFLNAYRFQHQKVAELPILPPIPNHSDITINSSLNKNSPTLENNKILTANPPQATPPLSPLQRDRLFTPPPYIDEHSSAFEPQSLTL